MKPLFIAIIGRKKVGKTEIAASIIRELSKRGYRIGAMKHVHHADFSIDTMGKDSWRMTNSGASIVAVVSPNELAVIEKKEHDLTPDKLIDLFNGKYLDVVVMEGFYHIVSRDNRVLKLIIGERCEDAEYFLREISKPYICYFKQSIILDNELFKGIEKLFIGDEGLEMLYEYLVSLIKS